MIGVEGGLGFGGFGLRGVFVDGMGGVRRFGVDSIMLAS